MTTTLSAPTPRSPLFSRPAAESAIMADRLETLIQGMTLSQLRVAATAALDDHVGDWKAYVALDVAVEPSTFLDLATTATVEDFHILNGLTSMTCGLILKPATGWPKLATVVVTAAVIAGDLRFVSVDYEPALQASSNAAAPAAPATLEDPAALAELIRSVDRMAVFMHSSGKLEDAFNWDDVVSVALAPSVDTFTSGSGDVAMEADATFTLESTGETVVRRVLVTINDHAADDASPCIDLI